MKPSGQGEALLFPHLSEVFLSLPRRENKPVFLKSNWFTKFQVYREVIRWALEYKMKQAKANRVLPREWTGHSKYSLPTTQEKTTHGHHQMVNTEIRLIIFFTAKDGEVLYSKNTTRSRLWLRSWTPYCQIQTYKLKKTGKTTRPFKYDWNPLQLYRESDK